MQEILWRLSQAGFSRCMLLLHTQVMPHATRAPGCHDSSFAERHIVHAPPPPSAVGMDRAPHARQRHRN
jgi:hypothetical protein